MRKAFFAGPLILASFLASAAFSYDNQVTHPGITEAALGIYGAKFGDQLTTEQRNWIISGSIAEDVSPRYLNHFYNPATGQGLTDEFQGLPAKYWAFHQDNWTSMGGDYSVPAILDNYRRGNYRLAYSGIGHILHLIQDMSVPAHTRNDAHGEGDPFEKWCQENGKININRINFIAVNNIESVFNSLSLFSHNDFLSFDTVPLSIEDKLIVKTEKDIYGATVNYGYYNGHKVILVYRLLNKIKYEFDFRVHLDYWNLLAPQAVGYSAGALDYFVRQFEQIDQEKKSATAQKDQAWWQVIQDLAEQVADNLRYSAGQSIAATGDSAYIGALNVLGQGQLWADDIRLFTESLAETVNTAAVSSSEVSQQIVQAAQDNWRQIAESIQKKTSGQTRSDDQILASLQKSAVGKTVSAAEPDSQVKGIKIVNGSGDNMDNLLDPAPDPETGQGIIEDEIEGNLHPAPSSGRVILLGDGTPPQTDIIGMPQSPASSTSASFQAASNEVGSSFQCDLDSSGWIDCLSRIELANLAEGGHTLAVRARDSSGNIDPVPAVYYWIVDTASPRADLASAPPVFSSSTQADLIMRADEISSFTCHLNADQAQVCPATTSYSGLIAGWQDFYFQPRDAAGNIGSTTLYSWLVDTATPTALITGLNSSYGQTGFTVAWTGTEPGSASFSGIADYDVEYQTGSDPWQIFASATSATAAIYGSDTEEEIAIRFRVRARDAAGNSGDWSPSSQTKISHRAEHLVISEVRIGGDTATDEFVELYNPTDTGIDLSGWRLSRLTSGGTAGNLLTSFPGIIIPPGGYYLVTHPTGYDGAVTADAVYSTANSIAADNTIILYSDAGLNIADKLGLGYAPEYETVSTANPAANQSAERKYISSSTAAALSSGLHRYSGNGYDTDNNAADFVINPVSDPQNSESSAEPSASDPIRPAAVSDLALSSASTTSLTLSWSAPAHSQGSAPSRYDLRYSADATGDCRLGSGWLSANVISSYLLPVPSAPGILQSADISGLEAGRSYCWAVKTYNGEGWSLLSNQISLATKCIAPAPRHSYYTARLDIANHDTVPGQADEHTVIFDVTGPDRGFRLSVHNDGSCVVGHTSAMGSSASSHRLIVEVVYNTATMRMTGQYRFCTDDRFNPNKISNNRCIDGNVWGGSRWASQAQFANKYEFIIFNDSSYTEWISPSPVH